MPEHAVHGQPALWWSQGAAQKSAMPALLVPDMSMRPAFSGQSMMGHGWASHMVRQSSAFIAFHELWFLLINILSAKILHSSCARCPNCMTY